MEQTEKSDHEHKVKIIFWLMSFIRIALKA